MFTPLILLLITAACSCDTEIINLNPNITTLYPTNKTIIRHDNGTKPLKKPPQTWKLEAIFTAPNLTEVEAKGNSVSKANIEEKETKERMEDFKPSQHLGSFFDEDEAEVIKTPIPEPVIQRPASGFVGSIQDKYPKNKIPKEFYEKYKPLPYNYEDKTFTKARPSWQEEPLDSKPTVEVPIRLPAGGRYQSSVTLKEKPISSEDYELHINEEVKGNAVKKRGNPWQDILRLVTAFIPVGLIISALTPSVFTIHNVDDNRDAVRAGIYRRSDQGIDDIAPISERCRRRLLCELQSDIHYTTSSSPHRRKAKNCYKIHCDDTDALWKMLRWLFASKPNQPSDDHRERYLT